MNGRIVSSHVILRRRQVQSQTGLSRSSIYAAIKGGSFPSPISLGARAVGWTAESIDNWIEGRINASRESMTGGAK